MAGQNGGGPIKLFQKHDADHLMRPGRRAERDRELGLTAQFGRKSVRPSDHENSMTGTLVAPAPEMPCEYGRIQILAALVQRHQDRFFGNMRGDRRGLFGHPRCRIARAAFGQFVDGELAESELAAGLVEPLEIALGKLPFGALLQPAHRNDGYRYDMFRVAFSGPRAICARTTLACASADSKSASSLSDRLRRPWALRVQSLETVELADLGSEHVHDHIAGIDQHPVAIGQALDVDVLDAVFLEAFGDVLRDRADLPVHPAGGDDHVFAGGRFASKV